MRRQERTEAGSIETIHFSTQMIKEQARYLDKGMLLVSFAETAVVVCPNCKGPAWMKCKSRYSVPFNPTNARVHCLRCSFERTSPADEWFGPVTGIIKERCPVCGFKWVQETIERKAPNHRTHKGKTVACPSCTQETTFPIHWTLRRFTGGPIDPAFGLPLWLQGPCAGNTLWVYNKEHLQELTAYIAATLRERLAASQPRRPIRKWSMFTRLPKWMKAARNREAIQRSLHRLEQRLQETKLHS
jgi:hypothetical protein